MQKEFVKHYAATGDATYAATKAGYSSPVVRGSELAHNPKIEHMTREESERILREKIPGIAVWRLEKTLLDDKIAPGVHMVAVKIALEKAGIGPNTDVNEKDMAEWTDAELNAFLRQQQRALDVLANRAKPVIEHEPGVFD